MLHQLYQPVRSPGWCEYTEDSIFSCVVLYTYRAAVEALQKSTLNGHCPQPKGHPSSKPADSLAMPARGGAVQ